MWVRVGVTVRVGVRVKVRVRVGACRHLPRLVTPTPTPTLTPTLTLNPNSNPNPDPNPDPDPDPNYNQESEERIDLDCTCIWIDLASGATGESLTSSQVAPLLGYHPVRDPVQETPPSPRHPQSPARTHLTITSPHAATAAVVNIATGVVSLVEVPQQQQQQHQQQHQPQAESPPPPRAMGVQPCGRPPPPPVRGPPHRARAAL